MALQVLIKCLLMFALPFLNSDFTLSTKGLLLVGCIQPVPLFKLIIIVCNSAYLFQKYRRWKFWMITYPQFTVIQ